MKRRRGLGASEGDHYGRGRRNLSRGTEHLNATRHYVETGRCPLALDRLLMAAEARGSAAAHVNAMGDESGERTKLSSELNRWDAGYANIREEFEDACSGAPLQAHGKK